MHIKIKERFINLWSKYFGDSDLPIVFYFSDNEGGAKLVEPSKQWSCLICDLAKVRSGQSLAFNAESITCGGARRYAGYSTEVSPNFRYFLSCGIDGEVRGERYKISPEVVDETQKNLVKLPSEGKYLIFKRWDKLTENDNPDVVIFFAKPEVLSGLFTLANFDLVETQGVVTHFSAGCGSIIHYPYLEREKETPKCVLGMFDPSARSCVPLNTLSFAVPMKRFEKIVGFMDETFLITPTWDKVKQRMSK